MLWLTTKKNADKRASQALKRGYAAAQTKARFGDFKSSRGSADYELRNDLEEIRAKSRWLARNSAYMHRFLWLLSINVVGKNGFVFKSRVQRANGEMDESLNRRVEEDFKRWSKRPSTCGRLSMVDLEKQAVKSLGRDGEFIWEIVTGSRYNDGVAINPLEADYLDTTLNVIHAEGVVSGVAKGNEIRMGVEIDIYNRPVAYHFLTYHPGDATWFSQKTNKRYRRVPANRIIHVFISDRAGQTRGAPWMASAINTIKMLDGYREAETTGRRLRSAIMGFFKRVLPTQGGIAELADRVEEVDNINEMSIEPGTMKMLEPGVEFDKFDPGGSQTDYADFENRISKSISMSAMISSMSLAMETEGISYSAGRTISLEDRDFYQDIQGFITDRMLEPLFAMWLSMRILQDDSNIPPTRLDVIKERCIFRPRGWDWVDPAKDVRANAEALRTRQTSLARVCAQRGIDRDDLLMEIMEDERSAEKYGLTLDYNVSNVQTNQSDQKKDNDDDGNDDDDES